MRTLLFYILLLAFIPESGTSFSVVAQQKTPSTTAAVSDELLQLLQTKSNDKDRLGQLVRKLVSARVTFDPKECIDGPFYCTCHFIGETPLWESIGSFRESNVKGQKYTFHDDDSGTGTFINYSEILGESFHLRAQGSFADGDSPSSSALRKDKPPQTKVDNGSFLDRLFRRKGKSDRSSSDQESSSDGLLRKCPYDYIATVTRASFHLFGAVLPINIEGTGCVRVLYADPNLRIFVSPNDTNVTSGGGDWERAGLTVVQVRQDLILGNDEKLVNET